MERAEILLAEANTIQKAKELKTLALTAADWAQRKGMGEKAVQHARSYALEAERKMGEMVTVEMEAGRLRGPGRHPKSTDTEQLKTFGLTRKESADAQRLASMPRETFEEVKAGTTTRTEARREERRKEIATRVATMPTGKHRVIYADPPWKYGDQLTEAYGATRFHYPAMTITDLCAMPVRELADDNAVLFLWVTSPILPEAFEVIRAWGFAYKASFVWDKIKHNMGHYNSVRHEFLLICTRGSCLPDVPTLYDSVQSIERSQTHSEKPEEFRSIIDHLYPTGNRLELFARKQVDGWTAYGLEA
jgi:N6-adenosine-specific RNA methylase IME4